MSPKNVWLIDGSSYLYRAFYALPPLTAPNGQPTGAVYGVINMLKRLQMLQKPDVICIVFDPPGKTARNDLYPDYKANRSAMPDDLKLQVEPLFNIIKALGLPLIQVAKEEADDVIGTLAIQGKARGHQVTISTADKDFAQLVCPEIIIQNTMSNKTLDAAGVFEKFGVKPCQIIDYLALTGDAVDNIPGIPKVGPKTAVKWLTEYENIANLVANAEKISGKIGENLRNNLEHLALYQQLVTIKTNLTLPMDIDHITANPVNNSKLSEYYHHLHFTKWAKELQEAHPAQHTIAKPKTNVAVIDTIAKWEQLLTQLNKASIFALDLETTSLNVFEAELLGIAFAGDTIEPCYVPIQTPNNTLALSKEALLAALQPLLANPEQHIVGHNLKYDLSVLRQLGLDIQALPHDTMLMSYVLQSHQNRHDLKTLAKKHLDIECLEFKEVLAKHQVESFAEVPLKDAADYAGLDAAMTWQLYHYFQPKIAERAGTKLVLETIEQPLINIIAEIERHGVLVDANFMAKLSTQLGTECEKLYAKAIELAGCDFNLASPKQLRAILFEQLNLPIHKKTPKGDPSTSEEALQLLVGAHELPEIILQYRHLSKLKSTYTDPIPKQILPQTHRVHCSFNQAVTITGRLSSNHPNLQNIPVKTATGREIRKAFIAPENHVLLCADYSQVELRVMAHLSQDEKLLDAFENNIDVHSHTAATLFDVNINQVSSEQRRHAKAINFGLMYGMSAFGLGKQLQIGRREAQYLIDCYFERYPGVLQYMEATRAFVRKHGYVETLCGRRLHLPDIFDRNKPRQMGAERAAINGPMQGTSADMIKLAMIAIDQYLTEETIPATMIMQVHDELIFEVATNAVRPFAQKVAELMAQAMTLSVPLTVNLTSGPSWGDQTPLVLDDASQQRSLIF